MSPSPTETDHISDMQAEIINRLPVSETCNPEVTAIQGGLVSIVVHLDPVPRNERGFLLRDLIEAGWLIDHIDLETGTAVAFQHL